MSNYSSLKLELLGLKWAVSEKFREYLLGTKFTVFTDNNPLSYLRTAKLGAVEQRWASQLALFDFEIKYRPGDTNQNADALSRLGDHSAPVAIGEVVSGVSVPRLPEERSGAPPRLAAVAAIDTFPVRQQADLLAYRRQIQSSMRFLCIGSKAILLRPQNELQRPSLSWNC